MKQYRAPGRVNLIGEHTDYNHGYVLPIAIDLACTVRARPSSDGSLRVTSLTYGETFEWDPRDLPRKASGYWTDYVLGVAHQFSPVALDLVIDSSVPNGGGLSSSASLEVAVALALANGHAFDRMELVRRTNRAEREFVGLPCGIMDQYASLHGEADHAILLDCRSETSRLIPLPDASFVVVNSMVKHALAESAYHERVRECAADAKRLGVTSLREVEFSPNLPKRARHVAGENARVLDFAAACQERDLAEMGRLMVASHESLRDDYAVSCDEVDFLVAESCCFPGVYGARMTGGGFGGCIVALVEPGTESAYEQHIQDAYLGRFRHTPEVYRVRASAGASEEIADSLRESASPAH